MDKQNMWGQTARLVDLVGSDAPLSTVLAEVVSAARVITRNECRAALFIHDLDDACLNLGVNGGLPERYVAAIQGFKVGEHQPSCGRAAFIGDEVIVPEIELDSRWAPYVGLAEEHSIKACWSFPILSDSTVLGTLAVYHEVPRVPEGGDAQAMRHLATIASAAIGRSKLRAAFETELRALPVKAPVPPPGRRSGEGVEALRKFLTAGDQRSVQ
jgi:GAF domain-containing protein